MRNCRSVFLLLVERLISVAAESLKPELNIGIDDFSG
jgi:hypothetical protein